MGSAMRAGLAILIILGGLRAELPRARADGDTAPPIPIHPRVVTILQLPDAIVHTWIEHHGEIRVTRLGNKLYVRPRRGTPAGVEASLEVQTRTLHRTFQLIVVARARDARLDVVVEPIDVQASEESPSEIPAELAAPLALPAEPMAPPPAVTPEVAEAAASAPTNKASPAPRPASNLPSHPPRAPLRTWSTTPRLPLDRASISLHTLARGLASPGSSLRGYLPDTALQRQLSLGLRLTAEPRDAFWSLEADVGGEWPAGPMVYRQSGSRFEVSGPRFRLELGMRASIGTKWKASAYVGSGIQVHLRQVEATTNALESVETMEQGGVLTLGVGLHYRTRSRTLLGLDFLVRQGGPDNYHSVVVLFTLGHLLDQGD